MLLERGGGAGVGGRLSGAAGREATVVGALRHFISHFTIRALRSTIDGSPIPGWLPAQAINKIAVIHYDTYF